jgi:hypothetical protein
LYIVDVIAAMVGIAMAVLSNFRAKFSIFMELSLIVKDPKSPIPKLHCLFPWVCITVFGHGTLHRQSLANIELVWSKKIRRSLKILDIAILPSLDQH